MHYHCGNIYVGHFVDGKACGFGELKLKNGDTYSGKFNQDQYTGMGTILFSNGNMIVGGNEYARTQLMFMWHSSTQPDIVQSKIDGVDIYIDVNCTESNDFYFDHNGQYMYYDCNTVIPVDSVKEGMKFMLAKDKDMYIVVKSGKIFNSEFTGDGKFVCGNQFSFEG